jgi:hypothetical protein
MIVGGTIINSATLYASVTKIDNSGSIIWNYGTASTNFYVRSLAAINTGNE